MRPPFNSLPHHSTQIQTSGIPASTTQSVPPSKAGHNQQQLGVYSPQIATPLKDSNAHLNNGNVGVPRRPDLPPSSCLMNVPSQFFPLQSGVGPLNLFHNGFLVQNLNSVVTNPANYSQPSGQFLTPVNQNVSLQNGQLFQVPVQNTGQFIQVLMPNYPQVSSNTLPQFRNQGGAITGPQNPNFIMNQQHFSLSYVNGGVQYGLQEQLASLNPILDLSAANGLAIGGQQLQGNLPIQAVIPSHQPQHAQCFGPPPGFTKSQENVGKVNGAKTVHNKWKSYQNKTFPRNLDDQPSHMGRFKSHGSKHNAKGQFRFHDKRGNKGFNNDTATKAGLANSTNQLGSEKKLPSLHYTDQEIRQWREDRKKNYPSKANIEKKMTEKKALTEVTDTDSLLRCKQLKEILAKQAELGCEVAVIPSVYLLDLEEKRQGRRGENRRERNKKGRFQNKFNNRGRHHQNEGFIKEQRSEYSNPAKTTDDKNQFAKRQKVTCNNFRSVRTESSKREATLLQKLLMRDIKREQSWLLQAFRFMVLNSYFKDYPEKPLKFPHVIVKDFGGGGGGEAVEEKAVFGAGGRTFESVADLDDNADTQHDKEVDAGGEDLRGREQEEGEITE